jgi:hypothetical protein
MRYNWKMLTLSLTLAAPLLLGQIAVAQTLPATPLICQSAPRVAQSPDELEAFFNAGYGYWDAMVLAKFWGEGVMDAKWRAGAKLLGPIESKVYLQFVVTDARSKALANAQSLNFYRESGYNYDDAERLARFWGKDTAYEGKLMIERNIIMGNYSLVGEALKLVGP